MENSMGHNTSPYRELCDLFNVKPSYLPIEIDNFVRSEALANIEFNERLAASLQVLLQYCLTANEPVSKVDKNLIDHYIQMLDEKISLQMDEILHHPEFQQTEALWSGLKYVIDHCDFNANIKIELLDLSKEDLSEDFAQISELEQSGLYKQVYEREYDTPGGEPFAALISAYNFNAKAYDLTLLQNLSHVAAAAHCPFIGSVGGDFFNKSTIADVMEIEDLANYMERAEYIKWNAFRESEDARYVGLTLPKFLLRLPYGENNPLKRFNYKETVSTSINEFLWGSASFAFAANMCESFKKFGWCVNIRGPESGGRIENLPLHQYESSLSMQTRIPLEAMISETKELNLASLGFIPLTYYKNSDYACFFSANSIQKPPLYQDQEASSNSRINARLPYIFLTSRIAHYLKVFQRENIGSSISRVNQEEQLNTWLNTLITKMNNPGPELAAARPLREGRVIVEDVEGNPGYFKVSLHAVPHFQVEGMDVKLSLVGQIPSKST